ncbi:MAG: DUF4861 family protein [Daejeonella sp.]
MKKIICLLFICGLFIYILPASAQQRLARIRIKNTSGMERMAEVVEVRFSDLAAKLNGASFRLTETSSKKEIPYQLELKGYEKPVNLLLQVMGLKPGQEITYDLVTGQPAKSEAKTFARFVPERKDDFAWENDVIAFRMYGKALETASDNATGTDVWSKRTDKLILNKWYKEGNYHTDLGEGMDYYQVGITLGAGDIAPYVKDSIILSKNYHHFKVLDNGPLRSTFQLGYDSWKAGDADISATKTISLNAGSQMNRVEVNYTIKGSNQTDVVSGIVKRKDAGTMLINEKNGVLGYWEPEVKDKGITGVGILTSNSKEMKIANGHLLSRSTIENNVPLVYYNGGAWNRAGKITTAAEWFKYLTDYKYKLDNPLVVTVEN